MFKEIIEVLEDHIEVRKDEANEEPVDGDGSITVRNMVVLYLNKILIKKQEVNLINI